MSLNDELDIEGLIRQHAIATKTLQNEWRRWVLGAITDLELEEAREKWLKTYTEVCEGADFWQRRHIENRRNTRARYLAEHGATEQNNGCELCGRQDANHTLRNIGTAPDHNVYACARCFEELVVLRGPLTPYGEKLETVKKAIEEVAEQAGQENTTIAALVAEGVREVAELYRAKNTERERRQAELYTTLNDRQLGDCGCAKCQAELLRRATLRNTTEPAPTMPGGKSGLLKAMLESMAERQGLKARQARPALWGLYTEPQNGAGPGEGLDTQAGHDDWPYGPLRSSREAPPFA